MKHLSRLKLALATLSMAFLGSCSSQMYTFAPNAGSYHGTEKRATEVVVAENTPTTEPAAVASTSDEPADLAPTHAQASAALTKAANGNSTEQIAEKATASDKNSAKQALKQAKADLKQLKKDIKDGKDIQMDKTVKLLIVLGLIFLLLGLLLPAFWVVGIILLVVGLILLVLGTL